MAALVRFEGAAAFSRPRLVNAMSCTLVDLEVAEDLVRLGERQVARQREIIARLKAGGHSVEMAEELLAEFEAALRSQLIERDQMRADVEPAP